MNKRLTLFIAAVLCLQAAPALGIWDYERPKGNTSALMGCWSDESVSYAVGFNGAVFRHRDGAWADITDAALADVTLFTVHGTATGAVYAAGFRLGPPRFDSNSDGQVSPADAQSRYGVIFRYTGSGWEELNTRLDPESPFFASSFVALWEDAKGVIYIAGGKQRSGNDAAPSGVLLSYDGDSFTPVIDASRNLPTINGIWGTDPLAYLTCNAGAVFKLDLGTGELSLMNPGRYTADFRGLFQDTDGTLYAVAESTYGHIFRYHETEGWQPMVINREEVPPLYCIAGRDGLLVAAGSYGKAYFLDRTQKIWKELLTGTQSHINAMCLSGDAFLCATSGGELYRMTEQSPDTAYILADPPTGIGTWAEGSLTHEVTLYDFSLGEIFKREWRFNNGSHHDPVPAYGILYSKTPEGATTALHVTGQGGEVSNRELRISDCEEENPSVVVTNEVIRLAIRSGHTTQNEIKALLENSPAVSEVYPRHGSSPWLVTAKEYDSIFLTGGRDDEDLFINEATSGDTFFLAVHPFKDKGTWEPSLTVYRENTVFIDGMIKVYGWRTEGSGPTIEIKDDGEIQSTSATGLLGGIIEVTAEPGSRGNFQIQLVNVPDPEERDPIFQEGTLYLPVHLGETPINELIDRLNALGPPIATAAFRTDNAIAPDPNTPWEADYDSAVTLEGGTTYAKGTYDGSTDTVTLWMDSGITTTTEIAKALSEVKNDPADEESGRPFEGTLDVIPGKEWNLGDHTNVATLPGVTTETVTTTVRVVDESAFDFTHTPMEAKIRAQLTLKDTSEPALDIIEWEWAVFRAVPDGYDTKAKVTSETGTAEVTVAELGKYDIGLKATLSDGSVLTMVKEQALKITGEHAGDSSLEGGNGCFVGAVSAH